MTNVTTPPVMGAGLEKLLPHKLPALGVFQALVPASGPQLSYRCCHGNKLCPGVALHQLHLIPCSLYLGCQKPTQPWHLHGSCLLNEVPPMSRAPQSLCPGTFHCLESHPLTCGVPVSGLCWANASQAGADLFPITLSGGILREFSFFFFVFLWPHLQHMEASGLGVESELQLPAYTTVIVT